jgi:hypothetical protein
MTHVVGFETVAELAGEGSVEVRLDALLADGRRLDLGDDPARGRPVHGIHEVEDVAPAAGDWRAVAATLAGHGIAADPDALAALPRRVVLGAALRARLSPPRSAPRSPAT